MANGTDHQRLIGLYQPTNKKRIVGLSIMTEETANQAFNISDIISRVMTYTWLDCVDEDTLCNVTTQNKRGKTN
jgi:hypothetical protein